MYGFLKGKTRTVYALYDTGAGAACVTRDGLLQFDHSSKLSSEKIHGLGGTRTADLHNIYIHHMNDDIRIKMKVHVIDDIMPSEKGFHLPYLAHAIQASAPPHLKALPICTYFGNFIDMLIGMILIRYFPSPIFTITEGCLAGLSIYKSNLKTHMPSQLYTIGGSYKMWPSFDRDIGLKFHNIKKAVYNLHNSTIPRELSTSELINDNLQSINESKPKFESDYSLLDGVSPFKLLPNDENIDEASAAADYCLEKAKDRKKDAYQKGPYKDALWLNDDAFFDNKCSDCSKCPKCKELATDIKLQPIIEQEEHLILESLRYDPDIKRFVAKLPFIKDPVKNLANNFDST